MQNQSNLQFHRMRTVEVLKALKTSINGLSDEEANRRLRIYGRNILFREKPINIPLLLLRQFLDPIVLILVFAVFVSFLTGEVVDGVVILIILILNALLGFTQEFKAEKSIRALKELSSPEASVIRNSRITRISAESLVPGDILVLDSGTRVSADARIIKSSALEVDESALTGESTSVFKTTKVVHKDLVSEQKNMVFAGSLVVSGHGLGVVVRTGSNTEIGKIAANIVRSGEKLTPLQLKLRRVGNTLGFIVILIAIITFLGVIFRENLIQKLLSFDISLFEERELINAFIASIALAVAAVPEGLPAVVTTTLAIGVRKLVKKNVLIRKLASVETLGSVSVICSDKTGTITKGEMTTKKIFVDNTLIDVKGVGYSIDQRIKEYFSKKTRNLRLLLSLGVLCNNSSIQFKDDKEDSNKEGVSVIKNGSPTELALLVSALKLGIKKEDIDSLITKIGEIPFSPEKKFMVTAHSIPYSTSTKPYESLNTLLKNIGLRRGFFKKESSKNVILVIKGAPEVVVEKCDFILVNNKIKRLSVDDKNRILRINEELSSNALRVLGFAFKLTNKGSLRIKNGLITKNFSDGFVFVGLQGLLDPPRPDVKEAIEKCKEAGIRVMMITGDYPITARAIASQVGISGKVISGSELNEISDEDYDLIVNKYNIYARVTPEHKFKILRALKRRGYSVAMTGDGVNDAPALKEADIGVAVNSGTDVAKEASDMVLLDNSFSSIVTAVEEGRRIYSNIKKFLRFLLSSNLAEVLVIFLAIMLKLPLPLIAVQILWVNLLTDGLPALALGFEPLEKGIMRLKPRKKDENILNTKEWFFISSIGFVMGFLVLLLFIKYLNHGLDFARSVALTSLVIFELVNVFNSKSEFRSVFKTEILNNPFLIISIVLSLMLQLIIIYIPYFNLLFKTTPLPLILFFEILALSTLVLIVGELTKFFINKKIK